MLDKCLNWIRLNKFGYFTITDLKNSVVGRSEKNSETEDLINYFLLIADNLNPGTYTINGQKDQNASAGKMSYSFVIAGDNQNANIGFVANNDIQNMQQKVFDMQIEHQKQLFDMKLKALEKDIQASKKAPKKDDTDAISKIAGILDNFAKLQPNASANVPTAQVGTTTVNSVEEAIGINLEIIGKVSGDEDLTKSIKNLAIMAQTNPAQLKQFMNMLNS